jgi:peptidoglycan hydrolase-like protein with peptidoglycan-binding domain
MSEPSPILHSATEGGFAATHIPLLEPPALVAPAAAGKEKEHNTLKSSLIPFACWRADDLRFNFESSFVLPAIRTELEALKALIDQHTLKDGASSTKHTPPVTVFGHADPVGNDDYNKALSGRRAAAIYGLLSRRDDIWEDLFSSTAKFTSAAAGDKWGLISIQTMLGTCGFPTGNSEGKMDQATREAVKKFQAANGLATDGEPGLQTRKKLFLAYMDRVCVQTVFKLTAEAQDVLRAEGVPEVVLTKLNSLKGRLFERRPEFIETLRTVLSEDEFEEDKDLVVAKAKTEESYKLEATQFLGRGQDKDGKADYQGCGEFNPVLLVSKTDKQEFDHAKDKTDRNTSNAANRRVLILLFRPGVRLEPGGWPCPRAKEGVAACKKRFWSDGEKRRANEDSERRFEDTHDTFACRFYHRLLTHSPCETILATVQIRLFDRAARSLPFAPCLVTQPGKEPRPDRASGPIPRQSSGATSEDEGKQDAFITVRDLKIPSTVNLKWSRARPDDGPGSPPPKPTDEFEFEMDVAIDIPEDNPEQAALTRLKNMGYVKAPDHEDPIRAFQRDYKPRFGDIDIDGKLNPATLKAIKEAHDTCDPVLKGQG